MINDELLHKWVNGTINPDELKEFQARPEYDSLKSLYENTDYLTGISHDSQGMLQNILNHKGSQSIDSNDSKETDQKRVSPLFLKLAVAASVILFCATFLFKVESPIINNSIAETNHELPHGSQITLYPGSEFLIKESDWKESRKVKLSGKAYFNVTTGNEFIVNTERGDILVLGTSFLVDALDNLHVKCDEGRVQVQANTNSKIILIAGESFTAWDEEGSIVRKNNMTKITNLPLREILKEIENTFDVKFVSEGFDLNRRHTSGYQHDNLENAIKTISMPLKMEYSIKGSEITLTK